MDEEVEQDLERRRLNGLQQEDSDDESGNNEASEAEQASIPLEEELEDYEEDNDGGERDTHRDTHREIEIEPFNLRNEREDGHFADGAFVPAERGHQYDAWLEEQPQKPPQPVGRSQPHSQKPEVPEPELVKALASLIELLEPSETPLEALENDEYDDTHTELVTAACEVLVTEYADIYDRPRELLKRELTKRAGRPLKRKRQLEYEFQWPDNPQVHGPYSGQEISDWVAAGYFTSGVKVRQIGEKWGSIASFSLDANS